MDENTTSQRPVYNALHSIPEEETHHEEVDHEVDEDKFDEADEDEDHDDHKGHHHGEKKQIQESFDFTDAETLSWRKVGDLVIKFIQ